MNEKESKYNDFFEDKEKIHFKIGTMLDENKREIKYYYGFDILNTKVYDLIVKRKNNSSFDLTKKDFLINDEKIIIKFKGKDKPISELFLYYYYLNQN